MSASVSEAFEFRSCIHDLKHLSSLTGYEIYLALLG